jgi:Tfp pilus assembly protein PilF
MLDFYLKPFQKHRDTVIAASEELTRIAKLIDAKEFATAHEVLDKAIKEKGENINYTFLKAIAFSKEGDKKKACILFQLALKRGYTVGFSQTATKEKIEEYLLSSCSSE